MIPIDGGASDEALATAAKAGERSAFEVLVRRHKAPLYGMVRRYVGAADDAYDVLQDTFASAWLAIGRYDPKRPFAGWIRTIALNKCRDFSRRLAVRRLFLEAFKHDQGSSRSPTEIDATDDQTTLRLARLDLEISRLAPGLKVPLLLTAIAGLSQQAAAAELGITAKAVELRIYRARKLLAQRMGEPLS